MATYILELTLRNTICVEIGSVGNVHLRKGRYCYVGSALKGLDARLCRHLSNHKKLHWHIDYILASPHAKIIRVWTSSNNQECIIAQKLSGVSSVHIPKHGIGSSDCYCLSHFLYIGLAYFSLDSFLQQNGFMQWTCIPYQ